MQIHGDRRHAASRGLTLKCGNRARMGQKEGGLLPDFGQQLIQVIRRWSAVSGLNTLRVVDIFQQSIFIVIDQLTFLALAQASIASAICSEAWS